MVGDTEKGRIICLIHERLWFKCPIVPPSAATNGPPPPRPSPLTVFPAPTSQTIVVFLRLPSPHSTVILPLPPPPVFSSLPSINFLLPPHLLSFAIQPSTPRQPTPPQPPCFFSPAPLHPPPSGSGHFLPPPPELHPVVLGVGLTSRGLCDLCCRRSGTKAPAQLKEIEPHTTILALSPSLCGPQVVMRQQIGALNQTRPPHHE